MLFHASLATPRSFPLFLLNCVQIGKFKICTQLRPVPSYALRNSRQWDGFVGRNFVCQRLFFGNNLKNEASKASVAIANFAGKFRHEA